MKNKKFNMLIVKRIDELRISKNCSWGKLAYESGISAGGMSEIKNGLVEPRLLTISKICLGLGITLKEFFNFDIDLSEFDE